MDKGQDWKDLITTHFYFMYLTFTPYTLPGWEHCPYHCCHLQFT